MLDIKMYDSKDEMAWCPGCGNYSILPAIKEALAELELKPHQVVVASGIGQAAKLPHYINTNGFNGLHGRAVPPASGIKIANKDLKVIIHSGDGDSYGEGGNHLMHGIRRNVDITHFVHDNQVYGLTKGQGSPTTAEGQKTSMQLDGVRIQQLSPLALAVSLDCSFVARSFSGNKKHLISIMKEAINHKGYALVDILQPCVIFNQVNTFKWYKDNVYYLDESYDPTDKIAAFQKALEWEEGIPLGVIYKKEKPTYIDQIPYLAEGPSLVDRQWKPAEAEKYMKDFL
ncbi:2-oxoglutarate ferredoxin oxidoreductase subunit beta [Natronincola peptidivorans]|uniref:2-oxoglutarate ferredoxin oxidoreductase subunit beta n=1 Tax=Natronincola peptidivorans TaxID=426128 RepID=A0A1I0BQG3_9FIRM|nr:2-oxoacid:ferredoxin oxidoreductase subunit beta [Natronincola peptidivorans]SET09190.1 2-oxoglutarate ferredoxin oxidoreductase subunit beta [Natronincola peptidivorans]